MRERDSKIEIERGCVRERYIEREKDRQRNCVCETEREKERVRDRLVTPLILI